MNNTNHRTKISDLLEEWANDPKQAKNIINCLVEFLTDDLYWLHVNISRVDRQTLIAFVKRLEHIEAPNTKDQAPEGLPASACSQFNSLKEDNL